MNSSPRSNTNRFLIICALYGLLLALFPWVFSFKGEWKNLSISIRSLGGFTGFIFTALGLSIIFSKSISRMASSIIDTLDSFSNREIAGPIVVGFLLYFFGIISSKLRAQYLLGTHACDLGFFSNICWNISQGDFFYSSLLERNFMAIHVNWILWPLSIFYRFGGGTEVLLVTQALFVVCSLPFLWLISKKVNKSNVVGILLLAQFCTSPFISHFVGNDFHPDGWQIPMLMGALWAWTEKKWGALFLFSFSAILAKEDVSFILAGFGLFLCFQKKERLYGGLIFIVAVSAFVFHTQFFIPRFIEEGSKSILFDRYKFLGNNYPEMIHNLFFNPVVYLKAVLNHPEKYWNLISLAFPSGGLVFLSPLFLIPPLISTAPHLLSQAATQLSLADIYAIPTQPFIFVGSVFGLEKLKNKLGSKFNKTTLAALMLTIMGISIFCSPNFYKSNSVKRVKAFHQLKELIPPQASVAAQQNLLPHFDTRRYIQIFPIRVLMPALQNKMLLNPEYIVCDSLGNALPANEHQLQKAITSLEKNPDYSLIYDKENFKVFHLNFEQPLLWAKAEANLTNNDQ